MKQVFSARTMSVQDFAALGIADLAFVKPVVHDGIRIYEIHSADGTLVGNAPSWAIAATLVRQHELEPASVH